MSSQPETNTSSELRKQLVLKAIEFNLPYFQYKLLAEWLDCYNYVLPADRKLVIMPATITVLEPVDLTKLSLIADLIKSTLPPSEQLELYNSTDKGTLCLCGTYHLS